MEKRDENGKFLPGHKGFKPIGSTSRVTTALRKNISNFLEGKWEKIKDDFDCLEPKDRIMMFEKLLQYSLPRLQSVEYKSDLETDIEGLTETQAENLLRKLSDRILDEWTQSKN